MRRRGSVFPRKQRCNCGRQKPNQGNRLPFLQPSPVQKLTAEKYARKRKKDQHLPQFGGGLKGGGEMGQGKNGKNNTNEKRQRGKTTEHGTGGPSDVPI